MTNIKFINQKTFETIFDDLFSLTHEISQNNKEIYFVEPVCDVIENDDRFVVDLYLAGIDKEDISIDVDDDTLTIEAKRIVPDDINFIQKQSYSGKYKKIFKLSETIDKKNIEGAFLNGVLTLKIPKTKESKKKKFSINIK